MTHHAQGSFQVTLQPRPTADGLQAMSIDKTFHGGIEGTSKGEMLSAGNPRTGGAGYVAMETITATLDGRAGTFVLQHSGTIDAAGQHLTVTVVPGTATGALQGLTGTFTLHNNAGDHTYTFRYTLPEN